MLLITVLVSQNQLVHRPTIEQVLSGIQNDQSFVSSKEAVGIRQLETQSCGEGAVQRKGEAIPEAA